MKKLIWIRCTCGKLHTTAMIGTLTKCTCGERLLPLVFGKHN